MTKTVTAPPVTTPAVTPASLQAQWQFSRQLQRLTNRVHAADSIEEIMVDLTDDICRLFQAERLTFYIASDDGVSITSKVKTGLGAYKDLKLPINHRSVAGHVAIDKKPLNVADAYDEEKLKSIHPQLAFLKQVDQQTGFRTRELLVAPVLEVGTSKLLGVLQLINNKHGKPFGASMEDGLHELCETISIALAQRLRQTHQIRSRYDFLLVDGALSSDELAQAQRLAREQGWTLEETMVRQYKLPLPKIGNALARYYGTPYEPYRAGRTRLIDLLRFLKRSYVEKSLWLPVDEDGEELRVMCVDPDHVRSARMVDTVFPGRKYSLRVTTMSEFQRTMDQLLDQRGEGEDLVQGLIQLDALSGDKDDVNDSVLENEIVKLVNKIIYDAHMQGASDIHIEPGQGSDKLVVRLRQDGVLKLHTEIPNRFRRQIVSRIKVMAQMDGSERRKPQDGKISFAKFGGINLELRVATLPSVGGNEDVVMRLLTTGEPIPIEQLGVLPEMQRQLSQCMNHPHGLIFVCGPTGSGKTTTVHSLLKLLDTDTIKVWTAEDPVEITQRGLRQVQINPKAGLDYPDVMRAFLRADPDVIMVGEMRDRETMSIGIEASLTGHLVVSTLHTNSAVESVTRLLDMGMEPYTFADAIIAVLGQRLVRKLCTCKQSYTPSADELAHFMAEFCHDLEQLPSFKAQQAAAVELERSKLLEQCQVGGQLRLYQPKGCDLCQGSGYAGRAPLFELLIGSRDLKRLIIERAPISTLLLQALQDGMHTLKMDGMKKCLMGVTDLKQVRAACA